MLSAQSASDIGASSDSRSLTAQAILLVDILLSGTSLGLHLAGHLLLGQPWRNRREMCDYLQLGAVREFKAWGALKARSSDPRCIAQVPETDVLYVDSSMQGLIVLSSESSQR